jgi:hypothetical protein
MPQWFWFLLVILAVVALLWLVGVRFDVNVS